MCDDKFVNITARIRLGLAKVLMEKAERSGEDVGNLAGEYLQAGVEAERLAKKPKA